MQTEAIAKVEALGGRRQDRAAKAFGFPVIGDQRGQPVKTATQDEEDEGPTLHALRENGRGGGGGGAGTDELDQAAS